MKQAVLKYRDEFARSRGYNDYVEMATDNPGPKYNQIQSDCIIYLITKLLERPDVVIPKKDNGPKIVNNYKVDHKPIIANKDNLKHELALTYQRFTDEALKVCMGNKGNAIKLLGTDRDTFIKYNTYQRKSP